MLLCTCVNHESGAHIGVLPDFLLQAFLRYCTYCIVEVVNNIQYVSKTQLCLTKMLFTLLSPHFFRSLCLTLYFFAVLLTVGIHACPYKKKKKIIYVKWDILALFKTLCKQCSIRDDKSFWKSYAWLLRSLSLLYVWSAFLRKIDCYCSYFQTKLENGKPFQSSSGESPRNSCTVYKHAGEIQ
mgnify:CR=1 FL=1